MVGINEHVLDIWIRCPPSPKRISSRTLTRDMAAVEMETRLRRSARGAKGALYTMGIGMGEEGFGVCS